MFVAECVLIVVSEASAARRAIGWQIALVLMLHVHFTEPFFAQATLHAVRIGYYVSRDICHNPQRRRAEVG
jgi:hypothetical protein